MQLPTLAIVNYGYQNLLDAYGNVNRWVASRDSGGGHWTYSALTVLAASSCQSGSQFCQQIVVTKPNSTDTITYLFSMTTSGAWNTQAQYVGASGLAATVSATYNLGTATSLQSETTTLIVPGGSQTKQVQYSYDSYGNVSTISRWNFGNQPPATADQETDISLHRKQFQLFCEEHPESPIDGY